MPESVPRLNEEQKSQFLELVTDFSKNFALSLEAFKAEIDSSTGDLELIGIENINHAEELSTDILNKFETGEQKLRDLKDMFSCCISGWITKFLKSLPKKPIIIDCIDLTSDDEQDKVSYKKMDFEEKNISEGIEFFLLNFFHYIG